MISFNYLLDILKFLIAGLGTVGAAFFLFRPYIQRAERIQILEIKKSISNQTLPLRLQAYERMVLFIERANPANLLVRINAPIYTVQELHSLVLNEIKTEYQHNISQQIYISNEAWQVVKKVKDDTINLFNNVIRSLPDNATGMDVSRQMLAHLSQVEADPYDIATSMIKRDLDFIF